MDTRTDSSIGLQPDTEPIDPEIARDVSNSRHRAIVSHSGSQEPHSSTAASTDSQVNVDLTYVSETSARTDLHALQIAASLVNKKVVAAAQAGSSSAGHASAIDLDLSHPNPSSMSNIQQQIEEVLGIQHSSSNETPDQVSRTSVEAAALSSVASNPHVQAAYTRILNEALSRTSNRPSQSPALQFYHETFRLPRNSLPPQGTRTLGMPVTAGEPVDYLSTAVEASRGLEGEDTGQGVVDDYQHLQVESHEQQSSQSLDMNENSRQDTSHSLESEQYQNDTTDPSFQTMNSMLSVGLQATSSEHSGSNDADSMMGNGRRRNRHKWSDQETSYLIQGCRIHGVGNWKKILTDPKFQFKGRTAVDLKDRFRTSFPEEYARLYPNAKTHKSTRQQFPVEGSELRKINRKERRRFTPLEDENLLKGFMKHGAAWSQIQRDKECNLGERRSTDLRDRFRNAFPAQYALAGFKGRGQYAVLNEVANEVDAETVAYLRSHETVGPAGDTVQMVMDGEMSVEGAAGSSSATYPQSFKPDHPESYSNGKGVGEAEGQGSNSGDSVASQMNGSAELEQEPQQQSKDADELGCTFPVYSGNLSPTFKAAAEAFAQSNLIEGSQDEAGDKHGDDKSETSTDQAEVMASIKIGSISDQDLSHQKKEKKSLAVHDEDEETAQAVRATEGLIAAYGLEHGQEMGSEESEMVSTSVPESSRQKRSRSGSASEGSYKHARR